jgi:putative phosphoserine phosphatase / 1-acylglycerol-3-phosphate O-acyltransferase
MGTIFSTDSNTGQKYIAFFDLDHTILNENSGKILIRQARNYGLITRVHLLKGFFLSLLYRFNLMETEKIIKIMANWVNGISERAFKELTADIFNNLIIKSIRPEILSELNFHKEHDARIVILSSSILPLCHKVSEYLGMDDVICSNLEVINGVYTGRISGPLCFGEKKVDRLIEYCRKNNVNPNISWYYGDSISDLQVLSSVGNPVCINPDKKLRKEAYKRDWKILQWH